MLPAPLCCLSSTHTRGEQLARSSGTWTGECLWHRGLFQLIFSLLAMPGDIFVFIAGAGSCLQMLIIDCSSSTREPVCEPPFTPPESHRPIAGPSLQLDKSCLGWSGGGRDGATCVMLCQPEELLGCYHCLLGGHSWEGKPKVICTCTRLPRLTNTFACWMVAPTPYPRVEELAVH